MSEDHSTSSRSLLRPPHLRRYHQIVSVFSRHGFRSVISNLGIDRHVSLPSRLLKADASFQLTPAEHLRLALEELGPTFIKLGQMLTTRPDLLEPDYIKELSKLRDDVPPVSWEAIRAVLVEELGDEPNRFFERISHQPLATASLGQVHLATLRNGHKVVVKIQRPDIQATIETDLEILRDLASIAERSAWGELNQPKEIVEEFAYSLLNELNYQREANNTDRFRSNFASYDTVHVPKVHWDYTTRRVLVMEKLQGIKADDIAALDAAGCDREQVAINATKIMLKEVLEDGFFHADPHAGNYFIMPGDIIGVLDFGLVGELSERDRMHLSRLYISVISFDTDSLVDEMDRMGVFRSGMDRARLSRDLERMINKYAGLPLKDIRMSEILEEFSALCSRHRVSIPTNLWLLGKTMVMTEGLGLQLDPGYDFFTISEPYVQELKRKMWLPKAEWGQALLRQGADWVELASLLPRVGRRLIEKVERNEIMEVGIKDTGNIMGGLNQLANRFSLSIVIAGLNISLAILISVTAAGSPIRSLEIAGFILIISLGVWLMISILKGKA